MNLYARAWRGVLRGLRTGDPGLLVGAGGAVMLLWLRRNPRRRELVGSYDLKPGKSVTIVLREPDPEP